MNRFQGISCLISKEILLVENTNFSNQRPYRSSLNEQNEQISVKLQISMEFQKTAFYHVLYLSEILPK